MLNEKASKLIGTFGGIVIFFITFIPKSVIDWLKNAKTGSVN